MSGGCRFRAASQPNQIAQFANLENLLFLNQSYSSFKKGREPRGALTREAAPSGGLLYWF